MNIIKTYFAKRQTNITGMPIRIRGTYEQSANNKVSKINAG